MSCGYAIAQCGIAHCDAGRSAHWIHRLVRYRSAAAARVRLLTDTASTVAAVKVQRVNLPTPRCHTLVAHSLNTVPKP
jgi:hypothetical protein